MEFCDEDSILTGFAVPLAMQSKMPNRFCIQDPFLHIPSGRLYLIKLAV